MSSPLSTFDQARAKVLGQMEPALKTMAVEIEERIRRSTTANVLAVYDIGAMVSQAQREEATYGTAAVEQLAVYLNFEGGKARLHEICRFAQSYKRPWLEQQLEVPMKNMQPLSLHHFIVLLRLEGSPARMKMLKRVRDEALSANALLIEINSVGGSTHERFGGRKPTMPHSPMARVQKIYSLSNTLGRFSTEYLETTSADLASFMADLDSETIPKAKETVEKAQETVTRTLGEMRKVKTRLAEVLASIESREDAEEDAAGESEGGPIEEDDDFEPPSTRGKKVTPKGAFKTK